MNCVFQMIFSCCTHSIICCWDIVDGQLLRSFDDVYMNAGTIGHQHQLELAYTDQYIVGYDIDCQLWLWYRDTGQLATRMKGHNNTDNVELNQHQCLITIDNQFAVTTNVDSIVFWDLRHRVIVRQVELMHTSVSTSIRLYPFDSTSVLCAKMNEIYRVNMPIVRFK